MSERRKPSGQKGINKPSTGCNRPYVVRPNLESAYAEMAKDKKREKEAAEWAEVTFKDVDHEAA